MRETISNISGLVVVISILAFIISAIWLIIRIFKKEKLKPSIITITCSVLGIIVFTAIGTVSWAGTEQYEIVMEEQKQEELERQLEEQKEIEERAKEEEEKRMQEELAKQERTETKQQEVKNQEEDEEQKEDIVYKQNEKEQNDEEGLLEILKKELDENVAEKAYDLLTNQIGFSNLEYKGKMEGLTNYEITADGYSVVLTASDDVYRIFIPNSSYIFYENEEVKLTYDELKSKTIDQYEQNIYYIIAQDIVCSTLKNPGSADFPSIVTHSEEVTMQKDGDIIAVQSYVEAKNDFNAKVRTDWIVEFKVVDADSYSYELIYANIGGNKVGKFIDLE